MLCLSSLCSPAWAMKSCTCRRQIFLSICLSSTRKECHEHVLIDFLDRCKRFPGSSEGQERHGKAHERGCQLWLSCFFSVLVTCTSTFRYRDGQQAKAAPFEHAVAGHPQNLRMSSSEHGPLKTTSQDDRKELG